MIECAWGAAKPRTVSSRNLVIHKLLSERKNAMKVKVAVARKM